METCGIKTVFWGYDFLKYNNLAKLFTFPNGIIAFIAIVELGQISHNLGNRACTTPALKT